MKTVVFVALLIFLSNCSFLKFSSLSTDAQSQLEKLSTLSVKIENIKNSTNLYAYVKDSQLVISTSSVGQPVASAEAIYSMNEKGWDQLRIKTNDVDNVFLEYYASGYLEGLLFAQQTVDFHHNLYYDWKDCPSCYDDANKIYRNIIDSFVSSLAISSIDKAKHPKKQILLIANKVRFDGLLKGIQHTYPKFSDTSLFMVNSSGNTDDFKNLTRIQKEPIRGDFSSRINLTNFYQSPNKRHVLEFIQRHGHCSALVKLIKEDGKVDLMIGHETWMGYNTMNRVSKLYQFSHSLALKLQPVTINFSSYPGVMFSADDFYINSYKIAVAQTTLNNFEKNKLLEMDLTKLVPPFFNLPSVMALASSTKEWIALYSDLTDHLYITEWIVVDYKEIDRMNKDSSYKPVNLIHILDESMGMFESANLTDRLLEKSFFGSFNVPFLNKTAGNLGYLRLFSSYSFENKLFNERYFLAEQLLKDVSDLQAFNNSLEYNSFKKKNNLEFDPSVESAKEGLASRYDLYENGGFFGGTDFKSVNLKLVDKMEVNYKAGPTTNNNENLQPFDFGKLKENEEILNYRKGLPDKFDFKVFTFGERCFDDK